jgi:photosystem II stability/assembly factor-like uncharacterized protein
MCKTLAVLRPGKTLLLACCLLLSLPAQAFKDPLDQPARFSAKAAGAMLLGVAKAGARLVAVGEHGIIVYSDNQGQSWIQAKVPVSVTLTAVQFPNSKDGWAVGHDGVVLSSTDGGQSWVKRFDGNRANALMLADMQKSEANAVPGAAKTAADDAVADVQAGAKFGPSRPLLGVWFKNAGEGYVVGSFGQIFHTADGGANWESLAGRLHNMDGLHYNSIAATAAGSLVIAGEGGKVYLSRDNGTNWQTLNTGYQGQLYGVLGIGVGLAGNSGETLLAFGFGGHVLLGSGDGSNWQELPGIIRKNLVAGAQLADGSVLLAGQDGSLLRSDDQVHGFNIVQKGTGKEIAGMVLLPAAKQAAISGIGGVYLVPIGNAGKLK